MARQGLRGQVRGPLGHAGDPGAASALRRLAQDDPDAVVRESAAWALTRL